jgi:hypothetical protein
MGAGACPALARIKTLSPPGMHGRQKGEGDQEWQSHYYHEDEGLSSHSGRGPSWPAAMPHPGQTRPCLQGHYQGLGLVSWGVEMRTGFDLVGDVRAPDGPARTVPWPARRCLSLCLGRAGGLLSRYTPAFLGSSVP